MNLSLIKLTAETLPGWYTENNAGFGERLGIAGSMVLRGMLTVFAVLVLLWGIVELFHFCVAVLPEKLAKKKKKEEPAAEAALVAEAPVIEEPAEDLTTIAVITAAIAAYLDQPQTSFRVVSFRRLDRKNGRNH